jgi:hypothetical protein
MRSRFCQLICHFVVQASPLCTASSDFLGKVRSRLIAFGAGLSEMTTLIDFALSTQTLRWQNTFHGNLIAACDTNRGTSIPLRIATNENACLARQL